MISCFTELCIYQNEGKCTLQEISIDAMGRCTNCLYMNIPSEQLRKIKRMFYGEPPIIYHIEPHPKLSASATPHITHLVKGKIKQGRIKKELIYQFVKN